MDIKKSLGLAIKKSRKTKKLTQEGFSEISSRTYVSTLERGLYSPTVEKVDALAKVIGIHPLTLLTLTYLIDRNETDPTKVRILTQKSHSKQPQKSHSKLHKKATTCFDSGSGFYYN